MKYERGEVSWIKLNVSKDWPHFMQSCSATLGFATRFLHPKVGAFENEVKKTGQTKNNNSRSAGAVGACVIQQYSNEPSF